MGPNIVSMIAVPILGAALDAGNGPAAWLASAAFLVVAALANAGRPHGAELYSAPSRL
jgi:hypothetical protein